MTMCVWKWQEWGLDPCCDYGNSTKGIESLKYLWYKQWKYFMHVYLSNSKAINKNTNWIPFVAKEVDA